DALVLPRLGLGHLARSLADAPRGDSGARGVHVGHVRLPLDCVAGIARGVPDALEKRQHRPRLVGAPRAVSAELLRAASQIAGACGHGRRPAGRMEARRMNASNILCLLGILTTTAGATWYSSPLGLVVFGCWC